ncbi:MULTISPECIES: class I SAM-dependent methyltransferase [Nocardia]|jgi:demethylmenaquinone methyltransferase/2-methoxy-6-polyprenyl-1,4-benzoquinol methylase|uniref:class I SAM-dependent methyltransferase n=1 Tax=Nocardia TaxID=1817 RepID=UPI002105721B|nr:MULTISPECIES: methyltransferase domain-containing protein [Nocardia]
MSRNQLLTPMFVEDSDTGIVIAGLRRYNLFTTVFFLGRQRRLLAEFVAAAGIAPGQRTLDIGCGPGKLVRASGAVTGASGAAVGVDPSAIAVADNRQRDRAAQHRYEQAPAQDLPFADSEFDVVTCTFVMHHIPAQHRAAAITEMWRVLRPGGRLLLADASLTPRARRILAPFFGGGNPFADADIRHYTDQLGTAGFTELEYTQSKYQTGILTARKPR